MAPRKLRVQWQSKQRRPPLFLRHNATESAARPPARCAANPRRTGRARACGLHVRAQQPRAPATAGSTRNPRVAPSPLVSIHASAMGKATHHVRDQSRDRTGLAGRGPAGGAGERAGAARAADGGLLRLPGPAGLHRGRGAPGRPAREMLLLLPRAVPPSLHVYTSFPPSLPPALFLRTSLPPPPPPFPYFVQLISHEPPPPPRLRAGGSESRRRQGRGVGVARERAPDARSATPRGGPGSGPRRLPAGHGGEPQVLCAAALQGLPLQPQARA